MRRNKAAAQRYLSLLAEPVPQGAAPLAVRRGVQRREGSERLAPPVIETLIDSPVIQEETVVRQPLPRPETAPALPFNDLITPAVTAGGRSPVHPGRLSQTLDLAENSVANLRENKTPASQMPDQQLMPRSTGISDSAGVFERAGSNVARDERVASSAEATGLFRQSADPPAVNERERVEVHTTAERAVPAATEAAEEEARAQTATATARETIREKKVIERVTVPESKVPSTAEGVLRPQQLRETPRDRVGEASATSGTRVRIGTVEIRNVFAKPAAQVVLPQAAPVQRNASERQTTQRGGGEPISRGLAWSYGLVQG
jgi:hypothetical protein